MGCIGSRVDMEAEGRQYHLKKLIASGGFSQIYCAVDVESGKNVAIKKIACHSSTEVQRTRCEIDFHRRLSTDFREGHKHIMPILGVAEHRVSSSSQLFYSLIFPLCKLDSLQEELSNRRATKNFIKQDRVLRIFHQICLALEVLHLSKPPIAHRDLKPANLLLQEENFILLTDFGSACYCPIQIENGQQSRKLLDEAAELCTMPYRAPELYTCETGTVVDQSVDIWSLGCVLYALCYFCSPYDEVHERGDSVALAVQSAKLNFNNEAPFNKIITEIISNLIKTNSSDRPTITQVLNHLQKL